MKKLFILLLFVPELLSAQNYIGKADSCFKVQDYVCAGTNYDLFLEKIENESNNIAYRSAVSWSLAKNKEKAFAAIHLYIKNNALNNNPFFSDEMLKEKGFDFLKSDSRWRQIIADVERNEEAIRLKEKKTVDSAVAVQTSLEKHQMTDWINSVEVMDSRIIYNKIRNYDGFPDIHSHYLSLQFRITDSLKMAFLVVLPANYDPKKRYSVLFFLHGAIGMNSGYINYLNDWDTGGWNRFYTKYANDVIMVYPHGNKNYNWMYPDKGFYMVPAILKQIKQVINIDDNRVFISGHSNGATGSFSYLMKQLSPFAAFYGFNTRPRVATGGTYIKNILNRSFFNVSTDSDYYYPPDANDSLSMVMKRIRADYQDHRYNGFPHWFPQFDQSEPAFKLLFDDLAKRKRNPFHPKIYWECDDVKYGRCDWIAINQLDTLAARADWQQNINFKMTKWIELDSKSKAHVRDTALTAFKFSKRSGAINANYNNNTFTVLTSDIKSFSILISPEMVELDKPVSVIVNGKLYSKTKIGYNKDYMIAGFKETADRSAIWVNHIDVNLP
jgi:hypothetical protein